MNEQQTDRRSFLKKAGAVAWAVPVMTAVQASPAIAGTVGGSVVTTTASPSTTAGCQPWTGPITGAAENPCIPDGFGDPCAWEGHVALPGIGSLFHYVIIGLEGGDMWQVSSPAVSGDDGCIYPVLDADVTVADGNGGPPVQLDFSRSGAGIHAATGLGQEADRPIMVVHSITVDVCHPDCE
jgi:hypothetical protein